MRIHKVPCLLERQKWQWYKNDSRKFFTFIFCLYSCRKTELYILLLQCLCMISGDRIGIERDLLLLGYFDSVQCTDVKCPLVRLTVFCCVQKLTIRNICSCSAVYHWQKIALIVQMIQATSLRPLSDTNSLIKIHKLVFITILVFITFVQWT